MKSTECHRQNAKGEWSFGNKNLPLKISIFIKFEFLGLEFAYKNIMWGCLRDLTA